MAGDLASVGRSRRKGDLEDYRLYLRDVTVILKSRTRCEVGTVLEAAIPGHQCAGRSMQVHHRRERSDGGSLRLPLNLVAVCDHCHPDVVHDDPRVREWDLRVSGGPNAGRPILLAESHDEYEHCGRRAARLTWLEDQ
jgi:hypothetical protein